MAVSDSAASGCPIPGIMLLALLYGAGESAARTLGQRLVDLVTLVHRVGGHNCSIEKAENTVFIDVYRVMDNFGLLALGNYKACRFVLACSIALESASRVVL